MDGSGDSEDNCSVVDRMGSVRNKFIEDGTKFGKYTLYLLLGVVCMG